MSRGKLSLPLESGYELSLYWCGYYKIVENKTCTKKLREAFKEIYDMAQIDIENHESVIRRLINCFSKVTAGLRLIK